MTNWLGGNGMEWNALGWKGQDRKGMNAANKMEDMNEIHSKTGTWNPTWNLNGHPLDLVGENLFQQRGKFAEPPETKQPGTQLGTWMGTPWTW